MKKMAIIITMLILLTVTGCAKFLVEQGIVDYRNTYPWGSPEQQSLLKEQINQRMAESKAKRMEAQANVRPAQEE